ncbi:hypothetical protein MARA_02330 (plasmid) [Mycolicibacterium arabiense]|uniref:Uncharacterized protein n=1 Tax=Mycolicibacterium arabiense TaxID=1286181 RepID=A0A7I7RQK0_9MYCO|nr:hypothetical protein [Mycolicibacterium arabiense]MCV7372176.1 hypothetical protein [Mycolicibacterium arabiense]BBY46803.1 hypothetical protein MARA_02330 [Mycolicibacterium arabiense]
MRKFGIASLIASALTAGVLGFATPAQADLGHHLWVNDITSPSVYVPHVDTTPHA